MNETVIFEVSGLFCAVKFYVSCTALRVRFVFRPQSYFCFCQTVEDFDISRLVPERQCISLEFVYSYVDVR